LKQAHQTMLNNLAKRKIADPWMLEVTTAPEPGTGSVAEATMDYAKAVEDGNLTDTSLFFFHRQASDEHDLTTREGARAAVIEASGPAAAWRDIDAIVGIWADPSTDRAFWERVWCNRLVQSSSQAFDVERWKALARKEITIAPESTIVIGFDGGQFHDSTGIVATDVKTGHQWVAGVWECPLTPALADKWQVPVREVDAVMRDLFERFNVWKLYADPPYWQSWIATWKDAFGEDRVEEWLTNRRRPMSAALEGFATAMRDGTLRHSGDPRYAKHIGNARREDLPWRDEQGKAVWLVRKERPDSPHKIDLAVAGVLSWTARTDAVAAGMSGSSVYEQPRQVWF
jgi:phage terminase large subunit-like protein